MFHTMDPQLLVALLAVSVAVNAVLMLFISRQRAAAPRSVPSNICRKCGYDIRASIGGKCPECGEPAVVVPTGGRVTLCSFCSKSSVITGPHVEGPQDAYICAPCVELCHQIIEINRVKAETIT